MGAIRVTPDEFVEKHARRTIAAIPDYKKGVMNVTEAPGIKAAEKADKMLAKLTEAVQSGKWGARVSAVTLPEWQEQATEKGAPRINAGVAGAASKVRAFASQLIPELERIKGEVDRMDDLTLEDSIARMTHQVREMSKFEFKR